MSTSLINTKIQPFNATAYHNGEFVDVSEQDVLGKWAVFFFYPADFTFDSIPPVPKFDLSPNFILFVFFGLK